MKDSSNWWHCLEKLIIEGRVNGKRKPGRTASDREQRRTLMIDTEARMREADQERERAMPMPDYLGFVSFVPNNMASLTLTNCHCPWCCPSSIFFKQFGEHLRCWSRWNQTDVFGFRRYTESIPTSKSEPICLSFCFVSSIVCPISKTVCDSGSTSCCWCKASETRLTVNLKVPQK